MTTQNTTSTPATTEDHAIARKEPLLLPMRLIPRTCRDSELILHLSRDHWRCLEAAIGIDGVRECWACGSADTETVGYQPIWRYCHETATRNMTGLELLCSQCALGRDPLLAMAILPKDELARVWNHYRAVNGHLDTDQFLAELDRCFNEYHERSRVEWKTELGGCEAIVELPSYAFIRPSSGRPHQLQLEFTVSGQEVAA